MTLSSTELSEFISVVLNPVPYFPFEKLAAMQHLGEWVDVAAKAKRLVQSGQVTILRNGPQHVMAHVIGDHGEYNCEITRADPSSQVIEQWNCECPWSQFAFDRTRKWKRLEGRVCSHVLAAYWKAKATPLDMTDQPLGYQAPPGQAPGAAPGQLPLPPTGPLPPMATQPGTGQPMTGQPMPSTTDLGIGPQPKPPYNPVQIPKKPQLEQLQLFDITAPPGMQPTPQATPVSVPGGAQPTPGSPVIFPGTFSHFIPTLSIHVSDFIYASDALTDYFEAQRAAGQPIYVALTRMATLELTGGKIPMPGAQPYGISSENVPLYKVMELGYNPDTGMRENADVNALQGAPEQTGTYADVPPGKRGEVLDYDPVMRMAYVFFPLNYPGGEDIRLHPHGLKGWVDYASLRPLVTQQRTPFRRRRA